MPLHEQYCFVCTHRILTNACMVSFFLQGWQIENPNVVLRSIDPSPPLTTAESCDWDETKLDEIESDCSRNHGRLDPNKDLWKDLLDSLVNIPLRTAPSVNGFRVTAEIPRSFSQYYE